MSHQTLKKYCVALAAHILNKSVIGGILLTIISLSASPPAFADATNPISRSAISLEQISGEANSGYGYKLQYYVAAPMVTFWRFKTDFDSDFFLSNKELIGHRLVEEDGNKFVTENRYATAPGLRFLWQTTVIEKQYRLEFKLLNPEDCRHDFHFGSIQLSPAGNYTKVTQIAFFNFRGASIWVKYPWYGGMKSTLTKVAQWEQGVAGRIKDVYVATLDE